MDVVIVRTKLQGYIVRQMLEAGLVRAPIHLVTVTAGPRSGIESQLRHLPAIPAAQHTRLHRTERGHLLLALRLLLLLIKARFGGGRLHVSNLHWFSLGLALKLLPGYRIWSFDDGSANVQLRPGSFLSDSPSDRPGLPGAVSRALFPRGVPWFVRSRIERHVTIYPGAANVVPPHKLDSIRIAWREMIEDADRAMLDADARRILLGTVYGELAGSFGTAIADTDIEAARRWADLYIPHPRQPSGGTTNPMLVRYPAEAIIDHFASRGSLTVAHYNSSVALSFMQDSRIKWIDLLEVGVTALPQVSGHDDHRPSGSH